MKNLDIKQLRQYRKWRIFSVVVAALLAFITSGICLATYSSWVLTGQIVSAVTIVALAWVLISVLYSTVKRGSLIVIGFAVVYIFGIVAYQGIEKTSCEKNTAESGVAILSPINNTLSIFFPSRGAYTEGNNSQLRFSYQLVHLLSYFFFALIAFSLFGRRMLNRSGHNLIGYRYKNLFWGYSPNGKVMAENILSHTVEDQVVFILPNDLKYDEQEYDRTFDQINAIDAVAIYDDFDKIKLHKRAYSGFRHFFISEEQDFNVRMALKVLDSLVGNKIIAKTHLYIRTELDNIDIFFEERLGKLDRELVEVHIYNHSDLAARQFIAEHPVVEHKDITINTTECKAQGSVNVLLLGFGWMGYELLKKIICDAQFMGEDFNFSVTVIDKDYQSKHGHYKYLLSECIGKENQMKAAGGKCNLEFNPREVCTVGSEDFYDWLNEGKNILNFNRIIVALGGDSVNVNTALELNRFRLSCFDKAGQDEKYEKIFAHVNDYDQYNYYAEGGSPITLFGGLRKTNCCEVLIDECMDEIAKLVNYVYSQYKVEQFTEIEIENAKEAIEQEWAKTSLFNQNSSRAVALNICNMALLAGGQAEFVSRLKESYFLELFAEYEHLRWNAFHFANGIRRWDFDQVTAKNGKLRFLGGNILTRHICLVSYDELDEASNKVNTFRNSFEDRENYKDADRRIVRHFPIFIKHKGNLK